MELADQIARIEAQEARLVLVTFDNDDALRLGELLVGMARERGLSITIDITRGDQQLFHAAMPGTSENNDDWIARKVRSVRRFGESSLLVGLHHQAEGRPFDAQPWNDTTRFTGLGGAIPIRIAGVGVVGAVAISGLAHESDHAFAAEGLELMISNH
jgi:uncharacterized protein (UPF0303 family)